MNATHSIAGLRISRVAPRPVSHSSLPDLEPPEERLRKGKSEIFRSDAIVISQSSAMEDVFDPAKRAERGDPVARLTVYSLNLSIMVISLPVGLAMFFLNILGGENLRTTAHVMALTAFFSALSVANPGLFGL